MSQGYKALFYYFPNDVGGVMSGRERWMVYAQGERRSRAASFTARCCACWSRISCPRRPWPPSMPPAGSRANSSAACASCPMPCGALPQPLSFQTLALPLCCCSLPAILYQLPFGGYRCVCIIMSPLPEM